MAARLGRGTGCEDPPRRGHQRSAGEHVALDELLGAHGAELTRPRPALGRALQSQWDRIHRAQAARRKSTPHRREADHPLAQGVESWSPPQWPPREVRRDSRWGNAAGDAVAASAVYRITPPADAGGSPARRCSPGMQSGDGMMVPRARPVSTVGIGAESDRQRDGVAKPSVLARDADDHARARGPARLFVSPVPHQVVDRMARKAVGESASAPVDGQRRGRCTARAVQAYHAREPEPPRREWAR